MYALHGSFPQKYLLPYQKSFMYQFFKGIVMSSDNSLQKKKKILPPLLPACFFFLLTNCSIAHPQRTYTHFEKTEDEKGTY